MGSETGKTRHFIKSKDIIPGYIVFGWPINNVVTDKSGVLTFAVEFNKKNDSGDITYRFNTLATTIAIKDGLILDDNIEAVSLDEDILSTLTNSSFAEDGNEAAVGSIVWKSGNGHGLVKNIAIEGFEPAEWSDTINLETTISSGVPSSIPVDLYAQAFVDSQTEVRYTKGSDQLVSEMIAIAKNYEEVEDTDNVDEDTLYFVGDEKTPFESGTHAARGRDRFFR